MYHFIQNANSPPPDIQNVFRFFSWVRVCMLYMHKLEFFHVGCILCTQEFFLCTLCFSNVSGWDLFFIPICMGSSSTTRPPILDLFDPGGHWSMSSKCTWMPHARHVHTVHTKCASVHKACTDHNSATKHHRYILFFHGGHWRCPLSAHACPIYVMCTLDLHNTCVVSAHNVITWQFMLTSQLLPSAQHLLLQMCLFQTWEKSVH